MSSTQLQKAEERLESGGHRRDRRRGCLAGPICKREGKSQHTLCYLYRSSRTRVFAVFAVQARGSRHRAGRESEPAANHKGGQRCRTKRQRQEPGARSQESERGHSSTSVRAEPRVADLEPRKKDVGRYSNNGGAHSCLLRENLRVSSLVPEQSPGKLQNAALPLLLMTVTASRYQMVRISEQRASRSLVSRRNKAMPNARSKRQMEQGAFSSLA